MSVLRIAKWFLPLFLLVVPSAWGVTPPAPIQACTKYNAQTTGSISCYLKNVTAGQKVVVYGRAYSTNFTVTSATESLTCPAAATVNHNYAGGANHYATGCYVDVASNHSSFACT